MKATLINDKKLLKQFAKAGVLKTFFPYVHVSKVDGDQQDTFWFEKNVYELRFVDGCFYPFLYLLNANVIVEGQDTVDIVYVGIAGAYRKKIAKYPISTIQVPYKDDEGSIGMETVTITTLSKLKPNKDTYFRFLDKDNKPGTTVYVYSGKDRKYGYSYYKWEDVNDHKYTKTDRKVIIDFTF